MKNEKISLRNLPKYLADAALDVVFLQNLENIYDVIFNHPSMSTLRM
jgi:hypothetical protein